MTRSIIYGLLFIVLAGFVAISSGNGCPAPPGDAFVTDLLAGQTIDVGNVTIWNDADYLYVLYEVTEEGWYITETHLEVNCSVSGIPQTPMNKNGGPNPIPGQFTYSDSFEPAEYQTSWCQVIEKPDCIDCGGDLAIAAHAVVVHVSNGCIPIYSDIAQGITYNNGTASGSAVLAWPHPSWGTPIPGAQWIWESYRTQSTVSGSVVDFNQTVTIPGLYPIELTGSMNITCDNGYELYVNDGSPLISAQLGSGWRISDLTEAYVQTSGWQTVENVDFSSSLHTGANQFWFATANEQMDGGTIDSNPAGLIYGGEICYTVVDQEETAWGYGDRFNTKGSWGMFVPYHWPCIIRFPEDGTAYIGYEDAPGGDYDYNDFGMIFNLEEVYIEIDDAFYLTEIHMNFNSTVKKAGYNHDIHINRTGLQGTYDYTITRDFVSAYDETADGSYPDMTGPMDVILFDTNRYPGTNNANMFDEVTIDISIDDPESNPFPDTLTPPRTFTNEAPGPFYDLDGIFDFYDPWMHPSSGGDIHITTAPLTTKFGSPAINVPFIVVVPETDFTPPAEGQTITFVYGNFDDFYRFGSPLDWW